MNDNNRATFVWLIVRARLDELFAGARMQSASKWLDIMATPTPQMLKVFFFLDNCVYLLVYMRSLVCVCVRAAEFLNRRFIGMQCRLAFDYSLKYNTV